MKRTHDTGKKPVNEVFSAIFDDKQNGDTSFQYCFVNPKDIYNFVLKTIIKVYE